MMNTTPIEARPVDESLVTYTHIIYALHALSALIGLTSSATIIGSFIFGLPSIVAVIMNYARQNAVKGTFLESHFNWQIRTFWYGAALGAVVAVVSALLFIVIIGVLTWFIGLALVGLWLIYRVARGWLSLKDRRAMYAPNR
jgi:uncharacterized membrane protein